MVQLGIKQTSTGPGWYILIDIQSNQDTYIYLKKQTIGAWKIFEVQKLKKQANILF